MDPDYYNLDDDTLSSEYANLEGYTTAIILSLSFIIGAIMDQSGRYFPLITGLLL
jgi:hypothetical protein